MGGKTDTAERMREGLKSMLIKQPSKDCVEELEERVPEKQPPSNPQFPGSFPLALAGQGHPQNISLSTTSKLVCGTMNIMQILMLFSLLPRTLLQHPWNKCIPWLGPWVGLNAMEPFPEFPLEGIMNLPISQFQRQTDRKVNELSQAVLD